MAAILIVEDELILSRELARFLEQAEHHVGTAATAADAIRIAREEPLDLVLLDVRLPDGSGFDVLDQLREIDRGLAVVLMTAYGSVREAVQAMQRGAADFLQKPLDLEELGLLVERLLARQRQDRELTYLRDRGRVPPNQIVGADPRILRIFDQVGRLADANLSPGGRPPILLTGETGSGKGMVAHAIHEVLGGGPFVELNCTAMPAALVESELFGHERGAFTDARESRPGLFEAAIGGSIFLDEIGDLDAGIQSKFLRVVEEKRVRRLGATRDRAVDVQVIAATHRNLDEAVEQGEFRADLMHRLRVLTFEIPPLRDRGEDLSRLAVHFCAEFGRQYGNPSLRLNEDAEALLQSYSWPGNVRELRNVLERAALLASDRELGAAEIVPLLGPGAGGVGRQSSGTILLPAAGINLDVVEQDLVKQALERSRGNRTRAAALLGLSRDRLRYRVEKFGLS